LSWSNGVRRTHRWGSMAFTLGVIVNIVTIASGGEEEPAAWVYLLALLPLAWLQFTGLYLLVLPYAAQWRSRRRTD
jgi:hypothetical protein